MSDEDDDLIILFEGADGDDDDGDGWIPRIALEHEGPTGHEMYVIVGEETGSMTEGVSGAAFEAIRARTFTNAELKALHDAVFGGNPDPEALSSAGAKLEFAVMGG